MDTWWPSSPIKSAGGVLDRTGLVPNEPVSRHRGIDHDSQIQVNA